MTEEATGALETAAPVKAKRAYNRITPGMIAKALLLLEEGKSVKAVAERLGCNYESLKAALKRQKKKSRKPDPVAKVEKKLEATTEEEAAEKVRRIKEARDTAYNRSSMIGRIMMKIVVEAVQAGRPPGSYANDMKALKEAQTLVKMGQEVQFASLGIKDGEDPDDNNLPELRVKELTQEQEQQIQAQPLDSEIDELGEVQVNTDDLDDIVVEGEEDDGTTVLS